jgi:ketol-acid reductoisomerase
VIDDHVRDNMRKLLSDIREGSFAQDWIEQMQTGEPRLKELRAKAAEERIEEVGRTLRGLMHREVAQPEPERA